MAKNSYSVKEMVQEFRDDIKEQFVGVHSRLDKIDEKQGIANGRVKKLELWRQFLLGAWAVVTMITPVGWYLVTQEVKDFDSEVEDLIKKEVQEGITKALEELIK
jgi:hypothetical protein